jgi:hypothetical protein
MVGAIAISPAEYPISRIIPHSDHNKDYMIQFLYYGYHMKHMIYSRIWSPDLKTLAILTLKICLKVIFFYSDNICKRNQTKYALFSDPENKNFQMAEEVKKFCDGIQGRWTQVGNENMDAINAGSNMAWYQRKVAAMMTVRLQVSSPDPTSVFFQFQTKLKNMDILLNYDGVTDHLGFKDEPVKSDLKVENGILFMKTWGMDYGAKMREFEHKKGKGPVTRIRYYLRYLRMTSYTF